MEYYIVRRGGHPHYASFLNNPDISRVFLTDKDFGSMRNAYKFDNPNIAHQIVRENDGEFQGSVIRTDGKDLYELEDDPRSMPISKR